MRFNMWPDAALYAPISLKCADSAAVAAVEQSQMQTAQTEVKIATHISRHRVEAGAEEAMSGLDWLGNC